MEFHANRISAAVNEQKHSVVKKSLKAESYNSKSFDPFGYSMIHTACSKSRNFSLEDVRKEHRFSQYKA